MWALVPWPRMELGSPALGAQSLSHWTTREVLGQVFLNQPVLSLYFLQRRGWNLDTSLFWEHCFFACFALEWLPLISTAKWRSLLMTFFYKGRKVLGLSPLSLRFSEQVLTDEGFPDGSVVKNPPVPVQVQSLVRFRCRFSPWSGRIPGSRKWQPTPVFLPEKSNGHRSLVGSQRVGHDLETK